MTEFLLTFVNSESHKKTATNTMKYIYNYIYKIIYIYILHNMKSRFCYFIHAGIISAKKIQRTKKSHFYSFVLLNDSNETSDC